MMPILSIIIPFFNQYDYIEECITSVYSSTFKDFEIILIDDGSDYIDYRLFEKFKFDNLRLLRINNSGV